MTRAEISLLLYLETVEVDYGGKIDGRRMNQEDFDIARRWNESGFIKFGRIAHSDISYNFTNWCVLSEDAWKIAHEKRRARAEVMKQNLKVERIGL